jgi:glycosyltransferase involved in cell wall biosynthesis
MRTLIVAPQPFYSPRGTPLSVYYRTLVLAEQGVDIDLLTYGQGVDPQLPRTRIVRIPNARWIGPIPIGPSWKKLFLDGFMMIWTVGLLLRHRYRVVHAHEEAVFWCRILKPVFRFRLVYDMHSSLPQQLINFGFTRSRAIIWLFRTLEDSCLRAADAVITICPDLRDYALSCGVDPAKHLLIENSIFDDVKLVSTAASQQSSTSKLGAAGSIHITAGRPTIVYAGTFEPYQGIDILIEAFGLVAKDMPDAQLLLVGGTPTQIEAMRRVAARIGAESSIVFGGAVDKTEAMRCTRLAQVLVSPRRHGTNTPLKIYEQLASGIPLVATRIWSHTQVLNDELCVLVEPDPQSLAAGLLRALRDRPAMAILTGRAMALYEEHYARTIYVSKIRRLLALVA